MRWDIFCRIIDHYGDIGVCWRLARQLAAEHGITVRLWLDDLVSLHRLCPETHPARKFQQHAGVAICQWCDPFAPAEPADVVIEAFGCPLPESYLQAMATRQPAPCWINLEYLTAETWIDHHHGLASPHPTLPLVKYFYFPGFSKTSGGLLREHGLAQRRRDWQSKPRALHTRLGIPPTNDEETLVSLFCYADAPVANLLDAWATAPTPVRCLLPESVALAPAAAWCGCQALIPWEIRRRGNLILQVLPFLRQEDYDLLLWACDFNCVRGEDSFVRAQWAARPLLWQAYVQEGKSHFAKLDAFLNRYCSGLDGEAAAALRAMHAAWNDGGAPDWQTYWCHHEAILSHAVAWAEILEGQPDLASNLVLFYKNKYN